ncbi:MAG: hypothetical protein MUO62_15675, partial [Anaerolineales bacterium]|nr:hypothetical protein [Anaerolineales bacterium]
MLSWPEGSLQTPNLYDRLPLVENVPTQSQEGSFVLVYFPQHCRAVVDLRKLALEKVRTRWYDLRTGELTSKAEILDDHPREFTCPSGGPDRVLVLDA